jgi:branched-chain amino acid transport system substrate-binding protein
VLAIDDQNEQGGVTIAGQKYTLNAIIRDTKNDVMLGKSVAEELVYDKKVKVIAGPFLNDTVGVQLVTEKNKVIGFFCVPTITGLCSPKKPYTFFTGGNPLLMEAVGTQYIQKFYPEAKTVFSVIPDVPDLPLWESASKITCPRWGLNWLGYEKFAVTTTDFAPVISRVLSAHKGVDVLDITLCGSLGAGGALVIKQLRQAGFNGVIWAPICPPPDALEEIVPAQYLTKVIHLEIDPESPIVSQACREMYLRTEKKFDMPALIADAEFYNGVKPFFDFINGQDTMDTTAWMQGFEKYHWQGLWGREDYWVGKPLYGINRLLYRSSWVSEYTDGKMQTKWQAPIPRDLFEGE